MVERGRRFAEEAGLTNASFVQGKIEDLPLPDESADVVISNGSINLSGRKSRVLAEAHRILRPGGRACITDLTLADEDLPPEIPPVCVGRLSIWSSGGACLRQEIEERRIR